MSSTLADRLECNIPEEIKAQARFLPDFGKIPWDVEQNKPLDGWSNPANYREWDDVILLIADPACPVDNIGWVPPDGYVPVDLDNIDLHNGMTEDVVTTLDSYTEKSLSGNGRHIIVRGVAPVGFTSKAGMLEIRTGGQIVLTGDVVDGRATIRDATDELAAVCGRYLPTSKGGTLDNWPAPVSLPMEDDEIRDKLFSDRNFGDEFLRLWHGDDSDHGYDASTADYHFFRHLLWLTQDVDQIIRLLRESHRDREKFYDHKTYLARTLQKAMESRLAGDTPFYDPSGGLSLTDNATEDDGAYFRFLDDEEIDALPEPEFLIDGVMVDGGLNAVSGVSGTFKSFLAIDWLCAIASGLDRTSTGHAVKRHGPVAYVAGEGSRGIKKRRNAWKQAYDVDRMPFYLLPEGPNLLSDGDVDRVVNGIRRLPEPPVAVALDTLNRTMLGDENKPEDMTRYVAACAKIRDRLSVAVFVVCHDTKGGEPWRGHSHLINALDVGIHAVKSSREGEKFVTMEASKVRDWDDFPEFTIRLEPIGDTGSCVVALCGLNLLRNAAEKLTTKQRGALDIVELEDGIRYSDWNRALNDRIGKEVARSTFQSIVDALSKKGRVTVGLDGLYRAVVPEAQPEAS